MPTQQTVAYRRKAADMLARAGIVPSQHEVADFALGDFEWEGLSLFTHTQA